MLYQNICPNCGAKSFKKINDTQYICEYCEKTFFTKKIEDYAKELSKLLDAAKLEMASNAKQHLYNAITAKYISNVEVKTWCEEVKKYLPDDFQANFYYDFINKSKPEVSKIIRDIDVEKQFEHLEKLIVFVIRSLEKSYVAAMKDLIERAYSHKDTEKYHKYTSYIEDEAEKLDKCIYNIEVPRDVFIAYSSKDSKKVIELVEYLESQKISCFISLRNLRHGAGAQENYNTYLQEAMNNCKIFVFVSSMNSRDPDCDAWKIEIPYIKNLDRENAPGHLRNDYLKISNAYKKPRVEYRIEKSNGENVADELVDEFFDGYARVYTVKDVASRIMRQLTENVAAVASSVVDIAEKTEEWKTFDIGTTNDISIKSKVKRKRFSAYWQNTFGESRYYGKFLRKNYVKAVKHFKLAAEWGNSEAQYNLGYCYAHGNGVEQSYTEAVKWYRKSAEQEHAGAQCNLGNRYYYGEGVTKDYAEAVKWYRKSAEQGLARAQYNLGLCYEYGNGVTKDYTEAVKWYKLAAEQGHAKAQNALGNRYYNGDGVTKDYTEAVKWYRKSAEQGHANAQCNLGYCYYNGNGVTEDYTEALKWFRLAAEQGDAGAQVALGVCYAKGKGVTKDYTEAVKWYKLAAEQGYASAQNSLGYCYAHGNGVEQSYTEAVKWYKLAAEQGHASAQYNLGLCYEYGNGVTKDYTEAVKWYRLAVDQGLAIAQYNLGYCYEKGLGVTQDYTEAVKWYRKSAEQGHAGAQCNLGNRYYNGNGVTKDYAEAVKWYRKSAEQGLAIAKYNLGLCYEYGKGVTKDYTEAIKWYKLASDQGHEKATLAYERLSEKH